MGNITQEQAIATLTEGQSELDVLLDKLTDDEMTRPATIGGGDWSAKDLLGHIAFWEELALQVIADWRAHRRPAIADLFASGSAGVDAANERNQARTAEQSLADVRARSAAAHSVIVEAIRSLSPDEWQATAYSTDADSRTLAETVSSAMGAPRRPCGHAFAHVADLRAYVESLGRS